MQATTAAGGDGAARRDTASQASASPWPDALAVRRRSRLRVLLDALRWHVRDFVITRGAGLGAQVRTGQAFLAGVAGSRRRFRYLVEAYRYGPTAGRFARVNANLESIVAASREFLSTEAVETDLDRACRRLLVLKTPRRVGDDLEKGVVIVNFTETIGFLVAEVDYRAMARYFHVVLEPSWAGYCRPSILSWVACAPEHVVVEATERTDFEFVERLNSNLIPVSFGFSDWVDFRVFHPLASGEKRFDAIYVANCNPIKRHHVLLRAIRQLNDPTYRAALVLGTWGGAMSEIESLLRYFGVEHNVEVYQQLSQAQVNRLLNAAKVNMLLSAKEGSNRSVFEGFFAGVPAIVLRRMVGMNKAYINDATGWLIEESELPRALGHFRREWQSFAPRDWALENISPLVTTAKLSSLLQSLARSLGRPWTRDIVPKVNAPELRYLNAEDTRRLPEGRTVVELFRRSRGAINEARVLNVLRDREDMSGGAA